MFFTHSYNLVGCWLGDDKGEKEEDQDHEDDKDDDPRCIPRGVAGDGAGVGLPCNDHCRSGLVALGLDYPLVASDRLTVTDENDTVVAGLAAGAGCGICSW